MTSTNKDGRETGLSGAAGSAVLCWWHSPTEKPLPLTVGVSCDKFLCLDLSGNTRLYYYLYNNAEWTEGEGDTQMISAWCDIRPLLRALRQNKRSKSREARLRAGGIDPKVADAAWSEAQKMLNDASSPNTKLSGDGAQPRRSL